MSMQILQLVDVGVPILILVAIHTLIALAYILFLVFPLMGRDYDAAIIASGFAGIGVGSTVNAVGPGAAPAVERGAQAVDRRGGFCTGRIGLRGCPRFDVVPGQIYRWRHDLRSAAAGFAEVVVAPGSDQRMAEASPALEIELGRDIRY
jgi:Sodium/glutamate symporter